MTEFADCMRPVISHQHVKLRFALFCFFDLLITLLGPKGIFKISARFLHLYPCVLYQKVQNILSSLFNEVPFDLEYCV